jgi:hypothetical protein
MTIRDIIINTGEYDGDLNSSPTTTSSVSVSASVQQVSLGGSFRIPRKKAAIARMRARIKRNSFARESYGSGY